MRTKLRTLAFAGALLGLALAAPPAAAARVYVRVGPPAVRVEVRGVAPSARHVWVGGFWRWNGSAHVWEVGAWQVPPRHGAVWIEGHWKETSRGWYFIPGHWK